MPVSQEAQILIGSGLRFCRFTPKIYAHWATTVTNISVWWNEAAFLGRTKHIRSKTYRALARMPILYDRLPENGGKFCSSENLVRSDRASSQRVGAAEFASDA